MTTYMVRMSDEQCSETETFESDGLDAAIAEAGERTREWAEGGDWGDDGAIVSARWELYEGDDTDAEPIDEGNVTVEIEPDHDSLMKAAGAPTDCDHDFVSTVEVEGGLRENPGVWGLGGTTYHFASHCRHCGLRKRETRYGCQRSPGQSDRVEYEMPGSWCPECESEKCRADRELINDIASEFDRIAPDQVDDSVAANGQQSAGHKGHENDSDEWPAIGWFCEGGNRGEPLVSVHPHDLQIALDALCAAEVGANPMAVLRESRARID